MNRWEYRIVTIHQYLGENGVANAQKTLEDFGNKGWELVSSNVILEPGIVCFVHHMKRPLEWNNLVPVIDS